MVTNPKLELMELEGGLLDDGDNPPRLAAPATPPKRGFSRKLKAQSWRCMIFTVVVSALIFFRVPPIQKGL